MDITVVKGDVLLADTECIVNSTNSIGVMGKGVALRFKQKYPKECQAYNIFTNRVQSFHSPYLLKPKFIQLKTVIPKYIMFFPTKISWRNDSKLEYIERNLPLAFHQLKQLNIASVGFPWVGCGNGNLNKDDVMLIFKKHIHLYNGKVIIYDY